MVASLLAATGAAELDMCSLWMKCAQFPPSACAHGLPISQTGHKQRHVWVVAVDEIFIF
jgi:hypothetical protein